MAKKESKQPKEEVMSGQPCAICHKKAMTLTQSEIEIPYFGKIALFSMTCGECKFHKADVEAMEPKEPVKYTFEISSEKDMKVRVVRSSTATIKIPHITTITPGPASNGYVTNIEGVLKRVERQVEIARDSEEDPATKKKAKNMLKKLTRIMWGQEKQKIIIEDPTGNSAIISENVVIEKLKVKK